MVPGGSALAFEPVSGPFLIGDLTTYKFSCDDPHMAGDRGGIQPQGRKGQRGATMTTIPSATLILTTLSDDRRVHAAYFENTPTGRIRAKSGQVFMVAPWAQVLAAINPDPSIRVIVRAEPGPDYRVSGGGSIYLVHPQNDAAAKWLSDHVSDEASWLGRGLAVEHRYIGDLVENLRNDGFEVR